MRKRLGKKQDKLSRWQDKAETAYFIALCVSKLVDWRQEHKEAVNGRTSKNRPSSESEKQGRDEN